ncbi:hypothetical protein [Taibaiella soli]|uniref:Uncharacterized protein n=1 Tax=Taibaiella soli TaxID=1649169 RepID=A0A2W2BFZ4_9BACT|nr:hypothetical protein [Taibaiella soli]PZF74827.1 hypothetical protein DN068_01115 [Taibaiella soli]
MKTPMTMSAKKMQYKLIQFSENKIAVSKKIKAVKSIEELMREADLHFEFAIEMIPRPRNSGTLFDF